MAIAPLKIFLFAAGGTAAVAAVAYVSGALDPYLASPPAAVAALPQPAPVKPEAKAASAPVVSPQPAPTAGAAPVVIAPSFDVVRVEPDGSIVMAGKAAASAKVEIVTGSKVIGSAVAGQEGDFAVVLDNPLKPGDYQIVLRSTAPDNVVATSTETAVVSVPETSDGQVLALVEEPGKPAELITVPEPAKTPATPPATAQAPAAQAPAAGQQVEASVPAAAAPSTSAPAKPAAGPKVAVEAVEIEGKKIFIAGTADTGRKVRAYANEILVGEAIGSPEGRFLIEAERDLPIGDYIIRVDALEPDGVKVAARAAVPFEREPGEAISAVAPAATAAPVAPVAAATEPKPATQEATNQQPAATAPVLAPAPEKPAEIAAAPAAPAPEATAPKLQPVNGAVIIRRGDSLWRISRRVYGQGLRFSTIYLANQDQIRDPDRIWPGQVFKVPEKTADGATADLNALGEQATTAPQ